MARALTDVFPAPEELIELEPEEIAVFLLDHLCEIEEQRGERLNRYNYTLNHNISPYAPNKSNAVAKVITEAWGWLEREGMVAPKPGNTGGDWAFVTRKGYKLRYRAQLDAYKKGHLLPKENLDENLIRKVWPVFIRGDYDTGVFQAFKEVEIRVREKAGLPDDLLGVNLMRKAFHPENGGLTNMKSLRAERQSMSDLFSGSIGFFKNPSSHREVNLNDPGEAAEIILFANYLLRIVERH